MNIYDLRDYDISDNIIVKSIDDVVMVYNKDNGDMYEMNDVGGEIFQYLREGIAVSEIINCLEAVYDASHTEILEAVQDFIIRMIELGVVII